ncbi:penicillin acylase family protein [Ensifer sp. ENS12]|nr:penicillin acylase family protein [Ensifer sp. ENS12]
MTEDHFEVSGVVGPIDICVDKWGVPHITAQNSHDVFFGQGFCAARSRMFQLDWWRRRGLGRISEVLGQSYVQRDRAARLFLYRGDMRAEWLAYGNDTRDIVTAFTAGINAWIDQTRENPELLSPEFSLLGYAPDYWSESDVVRIRSHGLYANIEQEVARAITIRDFGKEVDDLRKKREPFHPIAVPDGLDLDVIHDRVLATYRLGMGPVTATAPTTPPSPEGSNNWVISGGRTETGRPILANDPHRAMTTPSLRYIVHLKCPEFDVIGAGEPALPGISIGHNGSVAFGLTIWNVDQEDLYVYELHPEDSHLYRYRDTWVRMELRVEKVDIVGSESTEVELLFTKHGPVIHMDAERRTAFGVRAAWLEPGMAPYLSSLGNLFSRDANDVRKVLNRWGAPGVNHVYADVAGSIGWSPRALVPIRPNWDGLLPVPGDGRYEWDGFQIASDLPQIVDPSKGWVASANQMNLPPKEDWDPVPVSYEWYAPYRMHRIVEVLSSNDAFTVEAAARLQNDYLSVPARTICDLLPSEPFSSKEAEVGRTLLRDWNHEILADSSGALLFESWFRSELRDWLLEDALSGLIDPARKAAALRAVKPKEHVIGDASTDMLLIGRLAGNRAKLHEVLEQTLGSAVTRLRQSFGDDVDAWAWGQASFSRLDHVASGHFETAPAWATVGPRPKSGSSETVGLAAPSPISGIEVTGASFRIVVDVGAWDNSLVINSPGQDGDPRSDHYSDLYEPWLSDGYFPLIYSPEALSQHVKRTISIQPSSRTVAKHRRQGVR